MTNKPLTLTELIDQLIELRDRQPEYGDRPVHMLEMDDPFTHLVTHVETDIFDDTQGPVTSLLAWPTGDTQT